MKLAAKVIVATSEDEIPGLNKLLDGVSANGLVGLRMLEREQVREVDPHCSAVMGLLVPSTGITDYAAVARKYAEIVAAQGGTINTGTKVQKVVRRGSEMVVETSRGAFSSKNVINCAGLHSDRVSRMAGQKPEVRIVPFRGEYYDLVPEREHLIRTLIYPVPDPKFPFLGVHFTRRIQGGVDAGPNAVLAFKREGYKRTDFNLRDFAGTMMYPGFWHMAAKYWRDGLSEYHRSLSKAAFVKALQRLVPEIVSSDLVSDGSGVRAQAVRPDGSMVDDFQFVQSDKMLHVWNVPSPAATASLPIGRHIAEMARKGFGLA